MKDEKPTLSPRAVILTGLLLLLTLAQAAPARAAEPPSPPAYSVRLERTWIPMKDGVRLAANLFLPEGAKPGEKFPALLEYLPYRKEDNVGQDYRIHGYFARRGYVGAKVDIRGTGSSEGQTPDREYSEQEQLDGMEVIAWLARQPWSNGSVGMFGISWGGFNSIQMAGRRPPALKAIIAVDATEDLFQDDIHYIDGMMHIDQWAASIDLYNSMTGAPDFPLDEASLATRFDASPWLLLWLRQQRDGPFWERASLRNRLDSIQIPSLHIAGWLDGYRDSVPRMLARVKAPVKAIIGPWNHSLPHDAVPGPRIEWRHEAVRWWDRWLKGRDTGIMDEPRVAVYVRHWHPPDVNLEEIPGEWRSEEGWPLRRLREQTLHLHPDRKLERAAAPAGVHHLGYVPSAGAAIGLWWGELTPDQRTADAFGLVYDSEPLAEDTEILGFPRAHLNASATAPLAHWFARLSDVAPDGSVSLVSGAGVNGAHRESATRPRALQPGKIYPLEIEMHFTSWVFPRGHRVRLAVSNAAWPMIWPTPDPMTTALHLGGERPSRLVLPVVPREERPRPRFLPPEPDEEMPGVRSGGGTWPGQWVTRRDDYRGATAVEWAGTSASEYPWGRQTESERLIYEVQDAHPEAASVRGAAEISVHLQDRLLGWRDALEVRSDRANFYFRYNRELLKDGLVIRERSWEEAIPRDHQ